MNRKRIVAIILLVIGPIMSYYYIKKYDYVSSFFSMNNIVGIVAILSGITGIIMGISSSRQASLEAVKHYFQQGDEDAYSQARKNIFSAKDSKDIDDKDVSKVCNFFHFWGLMNRQNYLPIWVFDGSSGLQIVKLFITLDPLIQKKREENKFYAIEFEKLAYRIYKIGRAHV